MISILTNAKKCTTIHKLASRFARWKWSPHIAEVRWISIRNLIEDFVTLFGPHHIKQDATVTMVKCSKLQFWSSQILCVCVCELEHVLHLHNETSVHHLYWSFSPLNEPLRYFVTARILTTYCVHIVYSHRTQSLKRIYKNWRFPIFHIISAASHLLPFVDLLFLHSHTHKHIFAPIRYFSAKHFPAIIVSHNLLSKSIWPVSTTLFPGKYMYTTVYLYIERPFAQYREDTFFKKWRGVRVTWAHKPSTQ